MKERERFGDIKKNSEKVWWTGLELETMKGREEKAHVDERRRH
jgi:hypothetical protein